jgi:competence protein ComEC
MPLFWLSLAFLAGILFAANLNLSTVAWSLLAAALLVCLPLAGRLRSRLNPHLPPWSLRLSPPSAVLALLCLCLGAARLQSSRPDLSDPGHIAAYTDTGAEVIVVGWLTEPPDVRESYTNLRVHSETLYLSESAGARPVNGLLLARVQPGDTWHYGDSLILRGTLETPPQNEGFSYRDYLARQGVYAYMPAARASPASTRRGNYLLAAIYAIREHALNLVYRLWPDPEASLLAGILLGVETGIPAGVQQAFKDTGTAHIIAISGFNITILSGLLVKTFSRLLGRRKGALAAGLGIAAYTLLVGADPPVVRAALMGGLGLLARQVGRRQTALNSLAATAAGMALFSPTLPWDPGFQLSFAATLGLVLYADPFSQAFIRLAARRLPLAAAQRLAGPVGEYLLFTLAAQLTTLPITAYHFQRLSLSAILANPSILPAQPPILILAGLALLLGSIVQPLGQLAAPLAWPCVAYTIRAVEWFATFRSGLLNLGPVSLISVAAFYGLLFLLPWAIPRLRNLNLSIKPAVLLAGLAIATALVWRVALDAPDGQLHLVLLDVSAAGQSGDGILIQTPTGRALLIDGGPSPGRLSDALGRRLPLFRRQLDFLLVAAPREEQLAALPATLPRYPPDQVLWAGPSGGCRSARLVQELLVDAQIPQLPAQPGQILDLGEGAQLKVLTAGERGAILLLEWERFRALLPLGADFNDLEALVQGRAFGPVSALLLADNGYAPLNPPAWIANLRPQVVLLSTTPGDRDGLPSPETLESVKGYTLLRTDMNGWIELTTDGEQMWVEVRKR